MSNKPDTPVLWELLEDELAGGDVWDYAIQAPSSLDDPAQVKVIIYFGGEPMEHHPRRTYVFDLVRRK